jgi:hypothetical protein
MGWLFPSLPRTRGRERIYVISACLPAPPYTRALGGERVIFTAP